MSSLAEKYRPQSTDQLLGQPNADLIFNLSETYIAPSYLFFGQAGTGKTSSAKLLVSKIEDKSLSDLSLSKSDLIEYNCGMNGNVDDIKDLILDKCQMPPRILTRKYVILDECHMLTPHAQNALLNIMETPPDYLTLILCTTEPKKLLQAVKSRCLQVKFIPGDEALIVNKLIYVCESEEIAYEDEGLKSIAKASQGSYREGLMILSQYQEIGATLKNVSNYSGVLSDNEIDEILISAFSNDFDKLISHLDTIQKSNIRPEEVLRLILIRLTGLIKNKIQKIKSDNELSEIVKKISLIKACDIITASIKNISPLTPDHILLQISLFKLSALVSK